MLNSFVFLKRYFKYHVVNNFITYITHNHTLLLKLTLFYLLNTSHLSILKPPTLLNYTSTHWTITVAGHEMLLKIYNLPCTKNILKLIYNHSFTTTTIPYTPYMPYLRISKDVSKWIVHYQH